MLGHSTPKLKWGDICVWPFQAPTKNGQTPVSKIGGISSFRCTGCKGQGKEAAGPRVGMGGGALSVLRGLARFTFKAGAPRVIRAFHTDDAASKF